MMKGDGATYKKVRYNELARTKASRKYQLTINNPKDHDFTHEVIRKNLETFSGCLYWCMADEVGAEGTYHTHVYFTCENAMMFSTVQQRFYGAHIESAKGTHQENRDYIRKEGKWENSDKHETSVPGTFEESGPLPQEMDKRLKMNEAIMAMVQDGASNAEILREFPAAMNHLRNIEEARQTLLEDEYRTKFREVTVHYIWGATRVGKTRYVMEKYGYDKVFRVSGYKNPFDGYTGEPVLLLDEFRSSLPFSDLLKYLEGYPLSLPCRFRDRVACYTEVYIVSNIPLSEQYPNIQQEEPASWDALKARITECYQMLPDSTPVPFEEVGQC